MTDTLTSPDPAEMTDYRTIVVGTDGSELAGPTVARAAWLAHQEDAELVIVCAWTSQTPRQDAVNTRTLTGNPKLGQVVGRAAASSAIASAVAVAEAHRATIGAALLLEGEPAAALLKVAEDRSADVIVLGASQRVSLAERLLGTVATEVLRRAQADVLIVRPAEESETGELEVPESAS